MPGVRKLVIEISGDAKKAVAAFKEADDASEGMGGKIGAAGTALAGFAVAGAAAVGAFAVSSVSKFDTVAAAVFKMQLRTGESAEAMSRLKFAGQEVGIDSDTLSANFVKLAKSVEANNKAFDAYGIVTKDANGKALDTTAVLENTAAVFASMPDGMEKTALAVKLFGKAGADMIPLLDRGKDGIAALEAESDKFGVTIGQKNVDAYKKNLVAHREMSAAWEGLQIQIGEKLMPVVANITSWFAKELPVAITFVKGVVEDLQPTFERLSAAMGVVVDWVKQNWPQISTTIENVFGYVKGLFDSIVKVIEFIWTNFGTNIIESLKGVWVTIKGVFEGAFEIIKGIFDLFRDIFTGKWGKLWGDVEDIFSGVWTAVKAILTGALDQVEAVLGAAWTVITAAASEVWDGFKAIVLGVWSGIKTAVSDAVAFVRFVITSEFTAIKTVATDIWNAVGAVISTVWTGIKTGISDAVAIVKNVWQDLTATTENVWNNISSFIGGVVGGIKDVASGIWDDITGGIKGAINFVVGIINTIIRGIDRIQLHVTIPTPPGFDDIHLNWDGFKIPQIPTLAKGGVLTSPTVALMAEYAGAKSNPEIVTPQSILASTFRSVLDSYPGGRGQAVTYQVTVNVAGNVTSERSLIDAIQTSLIQATTTTGRVAVVNSPAFA